MTESTSDMRQVASALSYNDRAPLPAAKHLLLAAAMELDQLRPSEKKIAKPPIGLMPKFIWESRRVFDIMAAILRYENAGELVPEAWWQELRGHLVAPNAQVQPTRTGLRSRTRQTNSKPHIFARIPIKSFTHLVVYFSTS